MTLSSNLYADILTKVKAKKDKICLTVVVLKFMRKLPSTVKNCWIIFLKMADNLKGLLTH